ncbi:zinc-binding dehydrogenase [Embleya scabrispora]|uniref:zinc-binding dehydrogenase n=1 Tax=Embleya scabrispora TaxID=159449 RepID=UPI001F20B8FE|nr:zinc-binding dehydrogenase [Embleya scabrispora]
MDLGAPGRREARRTGGLVDRGRLTVEIAATYPLEEVGTAWDASRSGHTRGKIVLTP